MSEDDLSDMQSTKDSQLGNGDHTKSVWTFQKKTLSKNRFSRDSEIGLWSSYAVQFLINVKVFQLTSEGIAYEVTNIPSKNCATMLCNLLAKVDINDIILAGTTGWFDSSQTLYWNTELYANELNYSYLQYMGIINCHFYWR